MPGNGTARALDSRPAATHVHTDKGRAPRTPRTLFSLTASSAISRASASLFASGFSHRTCLPGEPGRASEMPVLATVRVLALQDRGSAAGPRRFSYLHAAPPAYAPCAGRSARARRPRQCPGWPAVRRRTQRRPGYRACAHTLWRAPCRALEAAPESPACDPRPDRGLRRHSGGVARWTHSGARRTCDGVDDNVRQQASGRDDRLRRDPRCGNGEERSLSPCGLRSGSSARARLDASPRPRR